jgi:hypothetical protein
VEPSCYKSCSRTSRVSSSSPTHSRTSLAVSELRKGAAKEEGGLPSVGDASYRVCAHEHEDGGIV